MEPASFQPVVGHASVGGCERGHFIENLGCARIAPISAHLRRQASQNLPVRKRLTRRIECLAHTLHPSLRAGECALLLGKAGPRQHNISKRTGLVYENILDHKEFNLAECLLDVGQVGIREHRVLTQDINGLDPAFVGCVGDLGDSQAGIGAQRLDGQPPSLCEFLANCTILDALVTRKDIRKPTHVAGTLHVVLAPQGVEPRSRAADMPRQQRQIGQRFHIVRAGRMLGDAHSPEDGRRVCSRIETRRGHDILSRHAGDGLGPLRGPRFDQLCISFEALRALLNKALILQSLRQDHMADSVDECNVRPGSVSQVQLGEGRKLDPARIGQDQAGAALAHGFLHLQAEHRMSFGSIAPDHEEHIRLGDIGDGVGHCS